MKRTRRIISRLSLLVVAALASAQTLAALTELADEQLSRITGQAVMMMEKNDTWGAASNLTFYKAGLDAVMEINANIKKLQLGCGGVNGPGCDIDIDNLSLSGNSWASGRPESSAILTRPFFEFAIRNDDSKTLREIVGIRMSAEQATGLLTVGDENSTTPNGINALSGYMQIAATTGTAQTLQDRYGRNNSCAGGNCTDLDNDGDYLGATCNTGSNPHTCTAHDYSEVLVGRANVSAPLCTNCGATRAFWSHPDQSSGVLLPSLSVPFSIGAFTLEGNRMTKASVGAVANVPAVALHDQDTDGDGYSDGTLYVRLSQNVCAGWIICVTNVPNLHLRGNVTGIVANINFEEDLGFIHKIPVNNPFSLSMQNSAVQWPGAAEVAQRGWWMSFQDPVDLGVLDPSEQVDISSIYPQLTSLLADYFNANPISVSDDDSWDVLTSGHMYKDVGTVDLGGATVDLNLQDLQLATQDFQPNCWGAAKFC